MGGGETTTQKFTFDLPLKIGLLLTTISWVSYVFYDLNIGIYSRHLTMPLVVEDIPAVWGVAFRMAAAVIALFIVVYFVIKRQFSKREAITAFRFLLVFEALYFLSFLAAGFNVWNRNYLALDRMLDRNLPSLVLGIVLPIVLFKLFSELSSNKPKSGAIKWGLIYVSAFSFALWFNHSGEWIATVLQKGVDYILQYSVNLLSFTVTTVGLLALFLYSTKFVRAWIKTGTLEKLDLKGVGRVVTLIGLYPLFIFLLWLFFGSVGGWGTWYAWLLGHGYMTFIIFPITFSTLPFLFNPFIANRDWAKRKMLKLSRNKLNPLLLLTEALGAAFFVVFSLAYYIPIPTNNFLIATEPFSWLMQVFGVLFLVFALFLTAISFVAEITGEPTVST
jgi:hypothetical protein